MHTPIARYIPRPDLDPVVLGAVAAAWLVMVLLIVLDLSALIGHDAILGDAGLPLPVGIVLFVVVWQLMTAAMMLPTSLPVVRAFASVVRGQPRPRAALGAFLAGYFVVWTAFAALALAGDAGLHWMVDRWAWLSERPWLITGGLLVGAGAFQFSPLKERCLSECRSPLQFLWRHYRRGVGGAWMLGLRHGVFCLGCCWALMLLMFAVGVGNLAWMAGLTGIMLVEKASRYGRRLVPIVGWALIAWGALVLVRPGGVAAHAGEAHAATVPVDAALGLGLVVVGLTLAATWRRRLRRGARRDG